MIKIIETHKEGEYGASYIVKIKQGHQVLDGFHANPLQDCPEDASLERDLYYAYSAVDFFRIGYEAGLRQEEVVFTEVNEEEEEK